MRISDFRIHNTQKLDLILAKLCEMIIDGQKDDPDYYGMVAACVLDTQDEAVCAVNYQKGDQRVHAEKAAVEKYMNQYGDIPAGSIIITTLSPCSEMMRERYGDDCTDLIEQIGVHKVYCGYEDPTQDDSSNYMHKTFHVMCTRNDKIKELCKSFADTFLEKEKIAEHKQIMEAVLKVDTEEMVPKFVQWSKRVLKLESDPEIELSYDTEEAQKGHHTGRHPGAWPELWTDGDGGGSISWQSKFKDKYGVGLPSDAVMASGMSGKKLPDLEKDPELKKIIKKPDEKKTAK
jgi:pyrimidine deaminase RibD-like protein